VKVFCYPGLLPLSSPKGLNGFVMDGLLGVVYMKASDKYIQIKKVSKKEMTLQLFL
jgi:hypothetical protein